MVLKSLCLLYLIIISFFDLRTGRIPNFLTYGFFATMLLSDIFSDPFKIPKHLLCACFFFVVFFLTALATKGLGLGDVKLAVSIGYTFGLFKTSMILIFACAIGIATFMALKALKREQMHLPFSPFVVAGYIIFEFFCKGIL